MKKIIVLLGVGIILFGCAHRQSQPPQVWVRPNSTEQEFNTDKYECMKEVSAMSGQQSYMAYGDTGFVIASTEIARRRANAAAIAMFDACMQSKGWTKQQPGVNTSPSPPPKERPVERKGFSKDVKYEPLPPSSGTDGCRLTNSPATYAIGSRVIIEGNKFLCDHLSSGLVGWRKLDGDSTELGNPARRRYVGDGVSPPFPRHLQEGCYWILDRTNWKEGNAPPKRFMGMD